jgi:hypothetical protein
LPLAPVTLTDVVDDPTSLAFYQQLGGEDW